MLAVQRLAILSALALLASAPACSAKHDPTQGEAPTLTGDGGDNTAVTDGAYDGFVFDGETIGPCEGLKCQQVKCAVGETTVSGTVYDPAGKNPLYNVIVYVPNAPLDPMVHGAVCDKCGTIASGKPIVTALTDAKGKFVLHNVPVGDDIPIVIQVGKWRRKVSMKVDACVNNGLAKDRGRLPRKKSEGDIPKIGLTTGGCDPLQCLFRKMGVDDSEFTDGKGKGSIHLYKGNGGGGVADSTDAMSFWSDIKTLKKYDMVVLSCECSEYPPNKGDAALKAIQDYTTAGGRVFGSHYHYYWFKHGSADFQSTANWSTGGGFGGSPYDIDVSFPKGKAFGDWLVNVGATASPKTIDLVNVANDVGEVTKKITQRWIYKDTQTKYLSFNTPVGKSPEKQCGRVVFSDLHVSSGGGGGLFPAGCGSGDLTAQEKALEFLFFDLAACLQKDDDVPTVPPPQ